MNLSENAEKVLQKRYLAKDENGKLLEDSTGMFRRVASVVAQADANYEATKDKVAETEEIFFNMMSNLEFLPNSPTLMNAGRPLGQLSACFVLPIEDSMEGIFDSIKNAALIHKSGGGTGFSFSRLRQKGSVVNSTGGVASGPVSFMKVFNSATEAVKQGGTRRGANMGILRVDHPDIMEFITCKKDNADITNFNISIGITEKFMQAVEKDEEYELFDPHLNVPVGKLSAKMVFDLIVDMSWNNGEPGVIFIDRLNRDNVTPGIGMIESTNPCVTGDTLILTDKGEFPIKDLVGQEVNVWNGFEYSTVAPRVTGLNQDIIEIEFSNGKTLKCTPYHNFITGAVPANHFNKVERRACDLMCGDTLASWKTPNGEYVSGITVVSKKPVAEKAARVYCFTEPKLHLGCFNGIVTGQCGEQPLLPYEACNLGSINLSLMVREFSNKKNVDFHKLKGVVYNAVHFLDNVIDVNKYPLPQIDAMTRGTRKIGLGIMGWADMLCKLGIPYNSKAALALAEEVMEFIQEKSKEASIELAKQREVFPYYDKSIYKDQGIRIRNATTTTIAPTGTLSIIAGVSSGIEPLFAISYIRNVMDNDELLEVNPLFKQIALDKGFYSDSLMRRIAQKGSLKGFPEVPDEIRNVFATAHDVSPEYHVKMQAAFQCHTDNAVSKTVNLPHDASKENVRDVFIQAYELNCKGVTLYRDGSRDMQVLNVGTVKGKDSERGSTSPDSEEAQKVAPRMRPDITTGFTEKVKIGCGNLYVTVNYDSKGICEVFTNTGRAGGCPSQSEATSRLVSIALRAGIDVKSIVEQLKGIRCPSTIRQKGLKVMSCPDAIGRLIEKVAKLQNGDNDELLNELQVPNIDFANMSDDTNIVFEECPECHKLAIEPGGGCKSCRACGFSKCG